MDKRLDLSIRNGFRWTGGPPRGQPAHTARRRWTWRFPYAYRGWPGRVRAAPGALQLRNLQSLVEIGVDKNTTMVFPAPLMSTIAELGSFLASEQAAATRVPPPGSDTNTLPAAPGEAADAAR